MTTGNWLNDVGRFCLSSGYASNYLSGSEQIILLSHRMQDGRVHINNA